VLIYEKDWLGEEKSWDWEILEGGSFTISCAEGTGLGRPKRIVVTEREASYSTATSSLVRCKTPDITRSVPQQVKENDLLSRNPFSILGKREAVGKSRIRKEKETNHRAALSNITWPNFR